MKKQTIIYTALLVFVCIFVCSFTLSIIQNGFPHIAFVGAGGAFGVVLGATISVFLHRDKEEESYMAWILAAALMYGISKIACTVTGCCNGRVTSHFPRIIYYGREETPYIPVQIYEVVSFIAIFILGYVIYVKTENAFLVSVLVMILSVIAKGGLDFLREAHVGKVISENQIMILVIGIVAVVIAYVLRKMGRATHAEYKDSGTWDEFS